MPMTVTLRREGSRTLWSRNARASAFLSAVSLCAWTLWAVAEMPNVSPCPHHQPDTIWDYNGTIGREKARLTLQLSGEQLTGLYFYYADLADLPVRGRVSSDRRVELTQVRSVGSIAGRF